MRDERTKLLTFVITWMDGVPSNLGQILAKMEVSSSKRGRKQRGGEKQSASARAGRRVYIG
jgi:hypothetical protein